MESPPNDDRTAHERETRASLGSGLFTSGAWDMLSVAVPLYGAAVGLNAAEIGLVVSARSVLPSVLSIHGGILIDRLGTRRVLIGVAVACSALPLLYPLSGWFGALVALQLLLGLASSVSMSASQTWIMLASRGDTTMLAHYSVVSRIGTFLGPVLVGAAWDLYGAWAAFACVSLCGAGIAAVAAYGAPRAASPSQRSAIGSLMPSWAEHKEAFALAIVPAVTFVLALSFLRNAPGAVQASLYVVYLADVGWSGTLIGVLVGLSEFFGVFGSLVAAATERRIPPARLMLLCIAASVAAIAVTPLIGFSLLLLIAAAAVRGTTQGMSQPLMYSMLSRAAPSARHGTSVGLRNAVVRFASILTPAAMGIAAEAWGIEVSFYLFGIAVLAASAALALKTRKA